MTPEQHAAVISVLWAIFWNVGIQFFLVLIALEKILRELRRKP